MCVCVSVCVSVYVNVCVCVCMVMCVSVCLRVCVWGHEAGRPHLAIGKQRAKQRMANVGRRLCGTTV